MDLKVLIVPPDCEIVTSRIMKAPIEVVFRAWAEADHLKHWWGPNGFTNTMQVHDFRSGGKWSFIMHGPDGRDYPNESVFIKVEAPYFIVWNHLSKPEFQGVALLEEQLENTTLLTFKMVFNSARDCDAIREYAAEKNEENLDRLEAELKKMLNL